MILLKFDDNFKYRECVIILRINISDIIESQASMS